MYNHIHKYTQYNNQPIIYAAQADTDTNVETVRVNSSLQLKKVVTNHYKLILIQK